MLQSDQTNSMSILALVQAVVPAGRTCSCVRTPSVTKSTNIDMCEVEEGVPLQVLQSRHLEETLASHLPLLLVAAP